MYGKPYKPQGNIEDYDPHESDGIVRVGLCLIGLYWLYECYEFITSIGPRDGWIGLTIASLLYLAITVSIGWGLVEEFRKTVRASRRE